MKRLLALICFMALASLAGQAAERPVRELPPWMVYSYHYGVGPVTTLASLLLRAAWFPIKTTGQVAWDTGRFIYNNPLEACIVIPSQFFVAYMFYKMGQAQYQESKRDISEFIRQWKAWQEEERLRKEY